MGKAYSLDLRERICAYVGRGHSARAAGRVFKASAPMSINNPCPHLNLMISSSWIIRAVTSRKLYVRP